jgi:hypothetical protein
MKAYSKLIVAVAVPVIGFALQALGLEVGSEQITQGLIAILTAAGVYAVPNA